MYLRQQNGKTGGSLESLLSMSPLSLPDISASSISTPHTASLRRSPCRFCKIATPDDVFIATVSKNDVEIFRMKSSLVDNSQPTLTAVAPSRITESTTGSMTVVNTTLSPSLCPSLQPPSMPPLCMFAGVMGISLLANNSMNAVRATRALGVIGMAVSTSSALESPAVIPMPLPAPAELRDNGRAITEFGIFEEEEENVLVDCESTLAK
mmetsp:Transcript_20722/g.34869  ORF Transcript_20722/g.34869 Transcript_20722/m.34869 type:complete len:209 (-) Transcript_20722:1402-2028(-)